MFIFWSSYTKNFSRQGACVGHCPLCNQEQAIAVFDVSQTDRVYGIKIAETLVSKFIACEVCGGTFEIPGYTQIELNRDWKISDGLAALADTCGHKLADRNTEMINRNSIHALLQRIASTRASFDISVSGKNFFYAVLIGGATAFALHNISSKGFQLFAADSMAHGFVGLIGGFLLALIGFTVRDLIHFNKTKRIVELKHFMKKLNLTKEDLLAVSDALPSKEYKIKGLVENL